MSEKENKMREISVEKITLNCGTGGPGTSLEKSLKLLNLISGMKSVSTTSKKRIPTWGVRPGLEIGCKVTIRGNKAKNLLKALLQAKKNELKSSNFDNNGNFSFGVPEYLDVPKIEYDPDIGIIGFEVAVTLQRKGFRLKRRATKRKPIPCSHSITKDNAIEYLKKEFEVEIK
jgi:large subunit ribosomal protein L5